MHTVALCTLALSPALALSPGALRLGRGRSVVRAALRMDEQLDAPPAVASAASQVKAALAGCEWEGWDERATWALEDGVDKFGLERGRVILWRRMSIEIPELVGYTHTELRARWLSLASPAQAARLGEAPPCLEDWVCVAPGRYEGAVHNLPSMRDGSLRATVEHDDELTMDEGCAAEGIDGQRRWVRTRSGALFELGQARSVEDVAEPADGVGPVESAASFARSLVSAAGGEGGVASGTSPPMISNLMAKPAVMAAGGVLAAAATALALFGHHINVSVFIV